MDVIMIHNVQFVIKHDMIHGLKTNIEYKDFVIMLKIHGYAGLE